MPRDADPPLKRPQTQEPNAIPLHIFLIKLSVSSTPTKLNQVYMEEGKDDQGRVKFLIRTTMCLSVALNGAQYGAQPSQSQQATKICTMPIHIQSCLPAFNLVCAARSGWEYYEFTSKTPKIYSPSELCSELSLVESDSEDEST